jgi:L-lactate dehydrogenase complex protein LldG
MKKVPDWPDNSLARAEILEKLRKAASRKTLQPLIQPAGPFFYPEALSLLQTFRKNLEDVNGHVTFVSGITELVNEISGLLTANKWDEILCPEGNLRKILKSGGFPFEMKEYLSEGTEVVISGCEYLVASLGSVLVSSAQAGSRRMFVYPPVHIVVARQSQVVETLETAYSLTIEKYGQQLPSLITVITGPSRTADIEKTLILGAHGPKSLHVIILEQEN